MNFKIAFAVAAIISLTLLAGSIGFAQQQAPGAQIKTAEQVYKNIQVLKGTPADQLNTSMHFLEGALGVDCEYCHYESKGDFASDDKEPKKVARKMITMVAEINKSAFGGEQVVTCYSCHRTSSQSPSIPALPDTLAMMAPYGTVQQKPALPPVDQILARYVQALGGENAIRAITSRSISATRDVPSGPGGVIPTPAQYEQYVKAPNLTVNIARTATGTISDGFDGKSAWVQNLAGAVDEVPSPDQDRIRRDADLQQSLKLKQQYSRMEVQTVEAVNGHSTYVVVGYPRNDSPEWLFFDTTTGLLLRKKTVLPSPLGGMPFEVDYDDYRDTGSGVKIPFWIRMIPAAPRTSFASRSSIRIQKVQDNIPIEDAKFVRPLAKSGPTPR